MALKSEDCRLIIHIITFEVTSMLQTYRHSAWSESRGELYPREQKKLGSGHFLETHIVKQHHLRDIPHIDY